MKTMFLILILLFDLFHISYLILPLWNFTNSGKDLLGDKDINESYDYIIYDKNDIQLIKHFYKENNIIKNKSQISINHQQINFDEDIYWDDIESSYVIDNNHYVCPKGRNYVTIIESREVIKPTQTESSDDDWELMCYNQPDHGWLFVVFLNSKKYKNLYGILYNKKDKKLENKEEGVNLEFRDFIWTTNADSNDAYHMFTMFLKDSYIKLQQIFITIRDKDEKYYIDFTEKLNKNIEISKANYYSYFISPSNITYWINYNNIDDFTSGYTLTEINPFSTENLDNFNLKYNNDTPLKFIGDSKIEKLLFIRNTKYVYYKINNNNTIYHGIIDIRNNRVIFNTNENIKEFRPLTNHSLIAITNNSAYEICLFKNEEGNCVNDCGSPENEFIDSELNNRCKKQDDKCNNYILYPENICIENCDTKFYILNKKQCGLCKDLNTTHQFKLINSNKCLDQKEENTYYISENLKIIAYCHESCKNCTGPIDTQCIECQTGYEKNEDGKCIKLPYNCHKNCQKCRGPSTNEDEQNCTSCKYDLLLEKEKGNCFKECPEIGYYENNKYCEKCVSPCESCKNETHCTTCINSFYFNGNDSTCYECDSNCETCIFGKENENEHCTKCKKDKFLFNETEIGGNCVENCPEGTTAKDGKCQKNGNTNYMLYIFIIIVIFIILLILGHIIYQCYIKQKENAVKEITLELESGNNNNLM